MPKTGDPEKFKDFEELYTAFEKQLQFCEDTLRHAAWISNILQADFLPCTWRSLLTGGCKNLVLSRRSGALHLSKTGCQRYVWPTNVCSMMTPLWTWKVSLPNLIVGSAVHTI